MYKGKKPFYPMGQSGLSIVQVGFQASQPDSPAYSSLYLMRPVLIPDFAGSPDVGYSAEGPAGPHRSAP